MRELRSQAGAGEGGSWKASTRRGENGVWGWIRARCDDGHVMVRAPPSQACLGGKAGAWPCHRRGLRRVLVHRTRPHRHPRPDPLSPTEEAVSDEGATLDTRNQLGRMIDQAERTAPRPCAPSPRQDEANHPTCDSSSAEVRDVPRAVAGEQAGVLPNSAVIGFMRQIRRLLMGQPLAHRRGGRAIKRYSAPTDARGCPCAQSRTGEGE